MNNSVSPRKSLDAAIPISPVKPVSASKPILRTITTPDTSRSVESKGAVTPAASCNATSRGSRADSETEVECEKLPEPRNSVVLNSEMRIYLQQTLSAVADQWKSQEESILRKLGSLSERVDGCIRKQARVRIDTSRSPSKSARSEITQLRLRVQQLAYVKSQQELSLIQISQENEKLKLELNRARDVEFAYFRMQQEYVALEHNWLLACSKLKTFAGADKSTEKLKKEIDDLREQINAQQGNSEQMRRQITQKTESESRLINSLKSTRGQLVQLSQEYQSAKTQLSETRKSLDTTVYRNQELEAVLHDQVTKAIHNGVQLRTVSQQLMETKKLLEESRLEKEEQKQRFELEWNRREMIVEDELGSLSQRKYERGADATEPMKSHCDLSLEEKNQLHDQISRFQSELAEIRDKKLNDSSFWMDSEDLLGELRTCEADLRRLEWKYESLQQTHRNWQQVHNSTVQKCTQLRTLVERLTLGPAETDEILTEIYCELSSILAISATLQALSKGHSRSHSAISSEPVTLAPTLNLSFIVKRHMQLTEPSEEPLSEEHRALTDRGSYDEDRAFDRLAL